MTNSSKDQEKEKMLFWRTVTESDDFSAAFDAAEVELAEFSEEDFDDDATIYEIASNCICYNPQCAERRYKDEAGRIYARCLASDVAGDVIEQLRQCDADDCAAALADLEKYLSVIGVVTRDGENILFADAPDWWRARCIAEIADFFEDEDDD